ncbi:MAG: hypothetical protein J0L92_11375 [Deltaproteobacteria bacterium]|nr:hypothetical protein [Deltaproteobacteria bacterium]
MGSVLIVGGWVELESDEALVAWRAKALATAKLTGWDGPIDAPAKGSAFDRWTIGELIAKAAEAPEPIEIVETARGVRFAAALASVTGRELWAPALLAAVRRASGAGQGGAWAFLASEGGAVLAVDLGGRGAFRALDEDHAIAAALKEPEMIRAVALVDGQASDEGALSSLAPRVVDSAATTSGKSRSRAVVKTKASDQVLAGPAKPWPKVRKLPLKLRSSPRGIVQLTTGEILIVARLGQLARGRLDGAWTTHETALGTLEWVCAEGARVWVGADDGLFVSDDGGVTFAPRGSRGHPWSSLLFVEGAIVGCRDGEVMRSTDDGATWTSVFRVDDFYGAASLARGPGDLVVATGFAGRVFVSRDLGRSFECVHLGPSEALHRPALLGEHAWYVGVSRLVRASLASPGDYERAGPRKPKNVDYVAVHAGHGTLWLACESQVVRSRDGGGSWEIVLEKPVVFGEALLLGPRRAIVLASDGHAYEIDG